MKKTNVLVIHGGDTFKDEKGYLKYLRTKSISLHNKVTWSRDDLGKALGPKFLVSNPRMPLQDYPEYRDWKLMFERYLPLLSKDFILVGGSLGGIFLAKYLSENKLKRKALSVYLVCPPFDNDMPADDLAGGFDLKKNLSLLEKNTKNLYLMFSADDPVIPVSHAEKYRKKLSTGKIIIYKSKNGHFAIPKFPEIVRTIKRDVRG